MYNITPETIGPDLLVRLAVSVFGVLKGTNSSTRPEAGQPTLPHLPRRVRPWGVGLVRELGFKPVRIGGTSATWR